MAHSLQDLPPQRPCDFVGQVFVPPHPLIKHWLSIARDKNAPPPMFRSAMGELGRLLIYECCRDWFETVDLQVETPCGTADATIIDPNSPIEVCSLKLRRRRKRRRRRTQGLFYFWLGDGRLEYGDYIFFSSHPVQPGSSDSAGGPSPAGASGNDSTSEQDVSSWPRSKRYEYRSSRRATTLSIHVAVVPWPEQRRPWRHPAT